MILSLLIALDQKISMSTECHPMPIKRQDFFNEVTEKIFFPQKREFHFQPFLQQQKPPDEIGIIRVLNWRTWCTDGDGERHLLRQSWHSQPRLICWLLSCWPHVVLGSPTRDKSRRRRWSALFWSAGQSLLAVHYVLWSSLASPRKQPGVVLSWL